MLKLAINPQIMNDLSKLIRYFISLIAIFACGYLFFSLIGLLFVKSFSVEETIQTLRLRLLIVLVVSYLQTLYFHRKLLPIKEIRSKSKLNTSKKVLLLVLFTLFFVAFSSYLFQKI